MTANITADDIIRILGLVPHPQAGHYREVYRDSPADGSRGLVTSIYFLLRAGECSHWHRVDAPEIMYRHAASPFEEAIWIEGRSVEKHRLGSNVLAGERPQVTVPAGAWRAAKTLGEWSLVGCAVAQAFQFAGFEKAPKGWSPAGHMASTNTVKSRL